MSSRSVAMRSMRHSRDFTLRHTEGSLWAFGIHRPEAAR